ncbi:MAG: hypothetical protein ACR2P2_12945, partial [Nakamurella sp.]
ATVLLVSGCGSTTGSAAPVATVTVSAQTLPAKTITASAAPVTVSAKALPARTITVSAPPVTVSGKALPAKTVMARVTTTETAAAIRTTVVVTAETTVTATASDDPAEKAASAPAEATPPSTTTAKRQSYSGSGDDVVDLTLDADYRVLTFTCSGCSGNTVLKADGEDGLLVNVVGSYTGRHLVNVQADLTRLEVSADSHWTLTLDPISVLAADRNRSSGHGDDVVLVDKGSKAAFTHNGADNFAVVGLSANGRDLLINEIGAYHGTVGLDTPEFLMITADGDWTISES